MNNLSQFLESTNNFRTGQLLKNYLEYNSLLIVIIFIVGNAIGESVLLPATTPEVRIGIVVMQGLSSGLKPKRSKPTAVVNDLRR